MDLTSLRTNLFDFVINGIDQYHFNRGLDRISLGFKSYNEFKKFQEDVINNLDYNSLMNLNFIQNSLIPKSRIIDRTNMSTYQIVGFVFDVNGNIVFYDPRK